MKALIFSDSHGMVSRMTNAVYAENDVSCIIFAGDVQRDVEDIMRAFPQIPVIYVLGNNDWSVHDVPFDRVFKLGEKRVFLTHGHKYHVKESLYMLRQKARSENADICIFGHTHTPFCEEQDGILMLNPGSAYMSYMTLTISGNKADAVLKKL